MGPVTLFDKSFLQSLSVDESMWFDNFFEANVCPLFYIETLADLHKTVRKGRNSEQEVRIIANKFPELQGLPNAHHLHLGIANLMGHSVPLSGRVMLPRYQLVESGGNLNTVFRHSPEAEAFIRWQREEFLEVERLYARAWRQGLLLLDLNRVADEFRTLGFNSQSCKSLEHAKALAENLFFPTSNDLDAIKLAFLFLRVPQQQQKQVLERWNSTGRAPLRVYAPYAAYLLTVQFFFQIALAAKLIPAERSSNLVDLAYLFYLPFCTIFVSCDKLHRTCAPLFLRRDQQFVWGSELKVGLTHLNRFYSQLPQEVKDQGVMTFAVSPPKLEDFFIAKLWDRHVPGWRNSRQFSAADKELAESTVFAKLRDMKEAPPLHVDNINFDPNETDFFLVQRRVRRQKGSWSRIAKDLKLRGKK